MAYDNLPRLPDPNTVPAGPGFVTQTLIDNTPGMLHDLNNGGTVSVKFAGSYWTINIAYPQLTVAEANTLIPFLYSLNGMFQTFYVQLPTYINPSSGVWDTGTSVKVADGEIAIGPTSNSIVVNSWSTRGGDYVAGDILKFNNSNKLYMVTSETLVTDTKTIYLNSDILEPVKVATAAFEPNDLRFRVRQSGKNPNLVLNADGLYEGFSLSLRENIL
jgi:hypothetical protein